MCNLYNSKMITALLKNFKIKNVILLGQPQKETFEAILDNKIQTTAINHEKIKNIHTIIGNPLIYLPKLENYDAIFINGDANWYTVFNELNIIKQTNKHFPLVFICNNQFPNKRRDSYKNPEKIPTKFRHEYVEGIPISYQNNEIIIPDGNFHAIKENTDKNGVYTAIEDFLKKNNHIKIMKINLINQLVILYPNSQLNEKRINITIKKSEEYKLTIFDFMDKATKNEILLSYFKDANTRTNDQKELKHEHDAKDRIINDYKNETNYKNSQIKTIESKLSLKDSKIKNLESKLINKENKINNLQNKLNANNNNFQKSENKLNSEIDLLNKKIVEERNNHNKKITENKHQLTITNSKINLLNETINKIETELRTNIKDNNQKKEQLEIEQETIKNNYQKIDTLQNQLNTSKQKIDTLQNQLNTSKQKIEKNLSKLKSRDEKLNENQKIIQYLERDHIRQMAKINNDEYCIECYKKEISNNNMEIEYLNNNTLTKQILTPLAYGYIIFKSPPHEILQNMNLYRALKNNKCFNVGSYLNENKDLAKSKWCKFFSPELHYVCNGFDEKRSFNKKFKYNTKKELINSILEDE